MADLRLRVLLSAVDRATAPLRKILGGSKSTAQGLARLQRTARDLTAFRELHADTRQAATGLAAARGRVAELAKAMRTAEAPTRAMRREFATAVGEARRLSQQHDQQSQRLHGLRQSLTAAGISTRDLGSAEKRLRSDIAATTQAMQQQTRAAERVGAARARMGRMHGAGMTMAAHGAGALYAGRRALGGVVASTMPGVQFDSAMSEVQALARLSKDSDEMRGLRQQARDLGASTLFSSEEVAYGQKFLAMAGFDHEAIRATMQSMLDIALAGGLDLDRAADITTNISSAFGIDPKNRAEMSRFADSLVMGFTTANMSLEDLGETMKYVGPIAKAANMDYTDAIAMTGMLGNVGIQGSMGGTTLREMVSRMASLPAPARKALDRLGVKTIDGNGDLRNLVEVVGEIDGAFKAQGLGSGERLAALNDIFGKRAMTGMADLSEHMGTGKFQEYAAKVANSQGTAAGVASVMADNMRGEWDQLVSAAKDVSIEIYERLEPTLRQLTRTGAELFRSIGQWTRENPELARTLGMVVAGASVALVVVGGLALVVGSLLMPLAGLQYGFTVLSTKLMPVLNGARMLLPALGGISAPLLAVIAAVVLVGAVIWKYWDPIRAFMVGMWDGLKAAFAPALEQLMAALAPLAPVWDAIATAIAPVWDWLSKLFQPFEATSEQLATATSWGQKFGSMLGTVMTATMPVVIALIGGVVNVFRGLAQVVAGAWGVVVSIFSGDGGGLLSALGTIWSGINTMLGGWPQRLLQMGIDMMAGLVRGVASMAGAVKDAVVGAVSGAVDKFRDFLGIRSPSRVFAQFGAFTMQGLAGGIDRGRPLATRAITAAAENVRNIGAGIVIGTAAAPMAMAGTASLARGGDTYEIHIHAAAGADNTALVTLLRAELDRIEREKAARARSQLRDFED